MKRFIAALLAGLTLFTLVGCSGGSKADSSTPKDYSQIIHNARSDEDNEYDMIFTKGEDGKFTAIDGYSSEYKADQLDEEIRDILMPLLNLEDDQYTAFAASISSMMVRSYAVAIVKPAEGKTDAVKAALEAYVATARSDFSDALALKAIGDIFDSLLDGYHGDKEARGKMHIAQCLAGMAFSNALLGIAHSLAHKTGAVFHIPHGCCNAILLPSVIQYNSRVCMNRYAAVARYLGLPGATDKQLTDSLVKAICALIKELGIEQTYQANGVSEELFKENAEAIAHNAVLDPCTLANPRPIDDEAMLKVLTCAYYGKPVTF